MGVRINYKFLYENTVFNFYDNSLLSLFQLYYLHFKLSTNQEVKNSVLEKIIFNEVTYLRYSIEISIYVSVNSADL